MSCPETIERPADPGRRLQNLRDVGGLPVEGGGHVREGVLYRSDAPWPDDERPALTRWPPRTVIDLRSSDEAGTSHPLAGPLTEVVPIPLSAEASITHMLDDPNALPADLASLYRGMLDARHGPLVRAVAALVESPGPILVHCTAGKDRTGLVVATALSAIGVPREAIVADYVLTAPNMRGVLDRILAAPALYGGGNSVRKLTARRPELLEAPAAAITAVLDELDARGGAAAWLVAHGLSEEAVAGLRDRLVVPRQVVGG